MPTPDAPHEAADPRPERLDPPAAAARGRRSPARLLAAVLVGGALAFGVHAATSAVPEASPQRPEPEATAPAPRHPVHVRGPDGPPSVLIGRDAESGAELRANCTTCHAGREPQRATATGAELDEFHTGLAMNHGQLTCLTCHDPASYDRLRLADGRAVEHVDSMRLCAQCHGPQHRDWQHGSHGGMTGYWDLTRGPRTRNHCVVCHDPHAPQIGQVLPAPPPNDRFLRRSPGAPAASGEHHD